ncbi:GspH/FimT family pseudopilin [Endozoicomonas montiporae]|uniref:Type II secretion system protein H n=1 Tax=Endozoicomonas montiporae CL-33 TaxID=570277 RepID=A0A142BAD1_9GAMM|nr:GspH/FimT family pseudopilin [Endozoicomonas montiporae]AMO55707.1 type-4 fimbrial pilin related signal peptide protein [Endozoicomonas montiporae CL-33]
MQYVSGQSGLTLPEVVITLLISAILVSMASPSLKNLVVSQRVSSVAQEIYTSFALARSEAVKRRSAVSLCASNDGVICNSSGDDWSSGWVIFTDADADGVLEAGDQRLRVFPAQPDSLFLEWNQGVNAGFNSKGYARKAGTFTLCEAGLGGDQVRQVVVSLTGRVRVTEPDSC